MFDAVQRRFIEPNMPYQPLGILHLTGLDSMRVDKGVLTEIKFLDGSAHPMSLRYSAGGNG
jgi:hypothetical protein